MGRFERGIQLIDRSWGVIREIPALIAVVAAGIVGHVLVAGGLLVLVLGRLPALDDMRFPRSLVLLPLIGAGAYVSTFCNAVVVATVHDHFSGQPASVERGFATARRHLPQLLGWTTVSITVGTFLIVVAERFGLAGRLAQWLLGTAWGLATALVVPVIVIEGASTRTALPRSARLFRSAWVESASGAIGVGLVVWAAWLAVCIPVALLALVSIPVAIACAVVLAVAAASLTSTLEGVFTTALYTYAAEGRVVGTYSEAELANAYTR